MWANDMVTHEKPSMVPSAYTYLIYLHFCETKGERKLLAPQPAVSISRHLSLSLNKPSRHGRQPRRSPTDSESPSPLNHQHATPTTRNFSSILQSACWLPIHYFPCFPLTSHALLLNNLSGQAEWKPHTQNALVTNLTNRDRDTGVDSPLQKNTKPLQVAKLLGTVPCFSNQGWRKPLYTSGNQERKRERNPL